VCAAPFVTGRHPKPFTAADDDVGKTKAYLADETA